MSGTDYTLTPNHGLYKPIPNADVSNWGGHWNTNADKLDVLLATSVLDYGADPTGVADSTTAFRNALATGKNVWAPAGTYLITGQLTLATINGSQSLRGDGLNTILLVDTRFDPTVTTGVLLLTGGAAAGRNDYQPLVADLTIRFTQPTDLITTATATSAAATNHITVASVAGIVVGMSVLDKTSPAATPCPAYLTWPTPLTVASIAGNVVTLSGNLSSPGVANGDTIQFAAVRSMFKTLAAGGTTGPGGTGVQYPWAIYNSTGQTTTIRNVMVINAWNGTYVRGSGFRFNTIYMGAFNVGLDIDQCYNFPSITDWSSWQWGFYNTPNVVDALANVYYDGNTVAANFGEVDGGGFHNFQTWVGAVNLTPTWTWGSFTNLMLDGNNANLNIQSTGNGFVQIANLYCSKGQMTSGAQIVVNAGAGFQAVINNINLGNASGNYSGISVQRGNLTLSGGYLWNGMSSATLPMIALSGGALQLNDLQLDASAGRVNTYVALSGTASLRMSDCGFLAAPGAGAIGVSGVAANPVTLNNNGWNGWAVSLPTGSNNWLPVSTSYTNDAAAATGGVAVGQLYRNGSAVMCRVT